MFRVDFWNDFDGNSLGKAGGASTPDDDCGWITGVNKQTGVFGYDGFYTANNRRGCVMKKGDAWRGGLYDCRLNLPVAQLVSVEASDIHRAGD